MAHETVVEGPRFVDVAALSASYEDHVLIGTIAPASVPLPRWPQANPFQNQKMIVGSLVGAETPNQKDASGGVRSKSTSTASAMNWDEQSSGTGRHPSPSFHLERDGAAPEVTGAAGGAAGAQLGRSPPVKAVRVERGKGQSYDPAKAAGHASTYASTGDVPSGGDFGFDLHEAGRCKPCIYNELGDCRRGSDCANCHVHHAAESWRRRRPPRHVRQRFPGATLEIAVHKGAKKTSAGAASPSNAAAVLIQG